MFSQAQRPYSVNFRGVLKAPTQFIEENVDTERRINQLP
jgi:hypothetical protein